MSVPSDDPVGGGGWAAMRPSWRNYADLIVMSLLALLAGSGCSFGVMPLFLSVLLFSLFCLWYFCAVAMIAITDALGGLWWLVLRAFFKAALFVALLLPCFKAGAYTHLALCSPYYLAEIVKVGSAAPIRFRWGSYGGAMSGLYDETLVYDPTDALAADVGQVRDASYGIATSVRHLVGHFYVEVRFDR